MFQLMQILQRAGYKVELLPGGLRISWESILKNHSTKAEAKEWVELVVAEQNDKLHIIKDDGVWVYFGTQELAENE